MQQVSKAQQVRNELKTKFGITSRDVSVRQQYCGYSRVLIVKIKTKKATLSEIEEIAEKHERIDYCHHTQEILSGGNSLVHVSFDSKYIENEQSN
jgi:hypothetical protein